MGKHITDYDVLANSLLFVEATFVSYFLVCICSDLAGTKCMNP